MLEGGTDMENPQQQANINTDELTKTLSDPDVQEALIQVLQKLPRIVDALGAAEKSLDFVKEVVNDQDAVQGIIKGIQNEFPEAHMDKETIQSLFILLNKLPKFLKMLNMVETIFDTVDATINDKQSVEYLTSGLGDFVQPINEKVQGAVAIVAQANERSKTDQSQMSIFGVLKLLKDPTVQQGLRFAKALLDVISESKQTQASPRPVSYATSKNHSS